MILLLLAIGAIVVGRAVLSAPQASHSRLLGTSGGAVPEPGSPQITPTSGLRTRNDFAAFSYLGGFTGGNLAPISVEPIILDPTEQRINEDLALEHAEAMVNAPQQGYGVTEPQSAAQTPENWDGARLAPPVASYAASGAAPMASPNPVPVVFRFFAPASAPATATLERSQP